MNNAKKTLKLNDISTTPIKLKYSASYGNNVFNNFGIASGSGVNGIVTITGSIPTQTINYRLIRQLYYQNYLTGSLLNSSSYWDSNTQSTACSGSPEFENRYFPTASNSNISFVSIPPKVFGEQISRSTFVLKPKTGTNYFIVDDGNGNLIDRQNGNIHVGNVIYSQGLVIITNSNYYSIIIVS